MLSTGVAGCVSEEVVSVRVEDRARAAEVLVRRVKEDGLMRLRMVIEWACRF